MAYWTDGSGLLELKLSPEEASSGYHSGDCEDSVRGLLSLPQIKAQMEALPMEAVRAHLREYGAWDEEELADDDMCLVRTLWLACADLVDNPQEEEEEEEA